MNIKKNNTLNYILYIAITLGLIVGTTSISRATKFTGIENTTLIADSTKTNSNVEQMFITHKVEPKQTYYQLSRIYSVPVKDIINANNNKSLKIGDTVKIPKVKVLQTSKTPTRKKEIENNLEPDIIEYKVGKSETLYAISKRFQVTIDDIKRANGLDSDSIKEGMSLTIYLKGYPKEEVETTLSSVIILPDETDDHQFLDNTTLKPNRYGIRENKERGIGVWLEDLNTGEQTSLALHKTAPVGTILKITNPMNNSITFAKVVGKFADNEDTQNAIVVLSKSVARSIGVLDKKFQIEITYGLPLE